MVLDFPLKIKPCFILALKVSKPAGVKKKNIDVKAAKKLIY